MMTRRDPAAAVLRGIRFRYRVQAYLILGHHFFLPSPLLLDIFIILFILVSKSMNRQYAIPSQLSSRGIQYFLSKNNLEVIWRIDFIQKHSILSRPFTKRSLLSLGTRRNPQLRLAPHIPTFRNHMRIILAASTSALRQHPSSIFMDFDTASQSLSPAAASHQPTLKLPATCDPPSEHNPPKQASWIIFGATGHMGRSLVRAVLSHGDQCTAVGWSQENTMEQLGRWHDGNCLGLLCDVRVRETVDHVMRRSVEHWGRVDIIANCTGYGVIGACEDQDDYDLRNQFNTNFMGTLHILQLSLPYFREQNHGRYLIFSSTAGALGVPGLGPYCATKYAVEGLIESMLYEIDIFNIKATLVEPGHVRLDEPDDQAILSAAASISANLSAAGGPAAAATTAAAAAAAAGGGGAGTSGAPIPRRYGHFFVKPTPSEPYSTPTSPAGHAKRMIQWLNDRQPVSAVKSAELVWQLGHCRYPPLRLLLGSYAVESIRDRLRSVIEEIEDWKHLSFPASMPPEDETMGEAVVKEEQEDQEDQDND
ncbi:unnamed protein product [Periconia digitata]|uniref:Uncharacterized protein n=1 Tax=Periconia digitata TaxID=1303443 RepID=A0A9W4UC28_9PLEO|nr:unnamed protein product [Periconia digitata]